MQSNTCISKKIKENFQFFFLVEVVSKLILGGRKTWEVVLKWSCSVDIKKCWNSENITCELHAQSMKLIYILYDKIPSLETT